VSYDGWYAWRSENRGGVTLAQLCDQYLAADDAATVPAAPEI
jgi:hypothetical protein